MADERNAPVWVTVLLALAGVLLLVVAIVYFAEPAKSLPSFFPGHDAAMNRHHAKHGIAALLARAGSPGARPLGTIVARWWT